MKTQSNREPSPLVVDETAFQQLLSAAFVMQEHNARLKQPAPKTTVQTPVAASTPAQAASPIPFPSAPAIASKTCQECGTALTANEFFCDHCGAPAERTGNSMQKNWASLWDMHQASAAEAEVAEEKTPAPQANTTAQHEEEITLFPAELEEIVGKFADETDEEVTDKSTKTDQTNKGLALVLTSPQLASKSEATAAPSQPSPWVSAAKARVWLDSLKAPKNGADWFREEWNLHRGIIAIALASAVLLAVLFQWTSQPASVTGQQRQLSPFEQLLVSVGLAEAPAPNSVEAVPGNPNTKVWEDVHTALYYCPGADLYGKTTDGKFTTQADAQRDNFQPSTLKACD